jgi:flagellar assembly protein FliH
MSRGVLSNQDYQYTEPGFLLDNVPWQEEIKKRLEEEVQSVVVESRPTLGVDEFEPLLLPENPEAVEPEAVEEVIKPSEPTPEEIMAKAKEEAEETAKSIEKAAKKNAFEIVEQARWEANDIIAKAKEDAEKEVQHLKEVASETGRELGLKEGFEKGYGEGLEKGKTEGLHSYSESVKKWSHLLEETVSERKRLLSDFQPMLVELVGETLHNCLKKEAKRHGQMVVEFAQEALKKARDRLHLKLHLNPEDVEEVESQKEQLQLSVGAGELELVPDARIEKGGCLLETEAGSIDVRLSTIVSQVKDSLSSEIAQR